MIKRIFTVTIKPELRDEFESDFSTVSVQAVKSHTGYLSVEIYKPSLWTPNQYMMISDWEDERAIAKFAGPDWDEAVIPEGMEKYVESCSVAHFESF